jgi:hypothetical protein
VPVVSLWHGGWTLGWTPQSLHFLSFMFVSFSHNERDVYHTVWGKRASVAWRFVVVLIPGNCVGQGVGSDATQQPSDNF